MRESRPTPLANRNPKVRARLLIYWRRLVSLAELDLWDRERVLRFLRQLFFGWDSVYVRKVRGDGTSISSRTCYYYFFYNILILLLTRWMLLIFREHRTNVVINRTH